MPRLPGGLRVPGQDGPAGLGAVRGGGVDAGPPDVHERPAVGLLVVAHLDHVDGAFQGEKVAGQGQGAAPLAGPGLGGQPLDARRLVVVGLGHRGVGLVAPRGADGFVLIIDAGRGLQGRLQVAGPVQGAGPPQLIDAQHLVGDGDPALRAHFLLDQGPGKDGRQVVRGDGLARWPGGDKAAWGTAGPE